MTLPRTAAEVLSGHVTLEIRCIDRVMLTFRQPRLQYGQGIHNFFCQHRGYRFVSSALMLPMTERFTADIRHYIAARLDLVRFARGQSKDQVAKEYLAGHPGGECILFVGVAQEKNPGVADRAAPDPATGKRYPWLYQEQAMVNHWYSMGSTPISARSISSSAVISRTPARSTSSLNFSRSRKLTLLRQSSVPGCPGDGVADQFGVAGV